MLRVTRDQKLTTAITGSYPRPLWYDVTCTVGGFKSALGDSLFRRIANINALRRQAPHAWSRPRDITSQTRPLAAPRSRRHSYPLLHHAIAFLRDSSDG
jgi:hypothetical protein